MSRPLSSAAPPPLEELASQSPGEREHGSAIRGSVAVLVSRFPKLTETFILREIDELERQGLDVTLVPLIRQREERVHPDARRWISRAMWSPLASVNALRGCLRACIRAPGAVLSAASRILAGSLTSPSLLARNLVLIPKALYLAEELRSRGIRHVHAHFATHPTTVAWLISRVSDVDYSFTAHAHDIFVDTRLLAMKAREARLVRAISRYNAEHVRDLVPDLPDDRVRVIRLGVDPERFDRRPDRRTSEGPDRPVRILTVAALRPYKGIDVLLEACARLRDRGKRFECRIVGDGPLRERLERTAARADLEDVVRFEGALTEEEVEDRLAWADLFVHPGVVAASGQKDGIPVALMEAMAAGLPVVASRLSGVPELVHHAEDGLLVEPADADGLADALELLLVAPERRRRLGEEARRTVRRDFDLEANTALLAGALEELVPGPPAEIRQPLRELLAELPQPSRTAAVGGVRRGPDAITANVTLPVDGKHRELVLKRHRRRPGADGTARERARREYLALSDVGEVLRDHPRLHAPKPVALAGDSLLMERCPGESLVAMLRRARVPWRRDLRTGVELAVTETGRWLGVLHAAFGNRRAGEGAIELLGRRLDDDLALLREVIDERERRLLRRTALELRSRATAATESEAVRISLCHRDFWPGNVLVSSEGVAVIDFEGAAPGAAAGDVAHFLIHLEAYHRRPGSRRRGRELSRRFLAGYGTPLPISLLRLARAAVAARLLAASTTGEPRHRRTRWLRQVLRGAEEWSP